MKFGTGVPNENLSSKFEFRENGLRDIFGRFEQMSVERRAFVNVEKTGTVKAVLKGVNAILPVVSAFLV